MKILVVEDEDSLRETIIRSLEKERYTVESAATFNEAGMKLNDYDYDCVVLDIMLPGGSGLTLLEELKKRRKRDSVIIISKTVSPGRAERPRQECHPPQATGRRAQPPCWQHHALSRPPRGLYRARRADAQPERV